MFIECDSKYLKLSFEKQTLRSRNPPVSCCKQHTDLATSPPAHIPACVCSHAKQALHLACKKEEERLGHVSMVSYLIDLNLSAKDIQGQRVRVFLSKRWWSSFNSEYVKRGFFGASNIPNTGTEGLFWTYQAMMGRGHAKTLELCLLNMTENQIVLLELQWNPCSCLWMSWMFHNNVYGWIFPCYSLFLLEIQQNSCSCLWMSLMFQVEFLSSLLILLLVLELSFQFNVNIERKSSQ